MAIKTQLRTAQLTGSFGNAVGLVGDQLANTPSGSASADDLAGILSQMASSIRRVNGATSFTDGALGVFNLATADFSNDVVLSSDAAVLSLGIGADVSLTHDNGTGGTLAAAGKLDLSAGAASTWKTTAGLLLVSGAGGIKLEGVAAEVDVTTTGLVDINGGSFDFDATNAIAIDSSAGSITMGTTLLDGQTLALGKPGAVEMILSPHGTAASETFVLSNTAGTDSAAIKFDALAGGIDVDAAGILALDSATSISIGVNADKPIDVDSTTFDLDASGAITIDGTSTIAIGGDAAAGNITIGGNATAREVTIGNTTGASGVTINCGSGNVDIAASSTMTTVKGTLNVDEAVTLDSSCVIAGDLTVNGTTTTVNSETLLVKDPVIAMGVGAQVANSNGGIAIMSGSNSGQDLVFGRIAQDTMAVGILDTQSGSVASVAGMAVTNFRASRLEIDSANDYLDVSTDLQIIAAADIVLNPGGNDVLVDASLSPLASDGGALGTTALMWGDLFLADAGVINFNNGNSTLTGGSALLNSNVAFRATKLEIDGASNNIDVSTDMIITAVADLDLRAGGGEVNVRLNGTNDSLHIHRASQTVSYLNFTADDGSAEPLNGNGGFGFRSSAGTMQFKSNGGSWTTFAGDEVTESKTVKELTSTVGDGTRIFGTGNGFDCSDIVSSTNQRVDVFVNGQMLVSSSMVTGDGDYALDATDGAADMDIKLEFAVVDDDIVQVVVR
jgi:hypothetical protein